MGYAMYQNSACRHFHQTYSGAQATAVGIHQNRFSYFSS